MFIDTNLIETIKKYTPEIISAVPIAAMFAHLRTRRKYRRLRSGYGRYVREVKSNNWLRRHGYRMRRKAR